MEDYIILPSIDNIDNNVFNHCIEIIKMLKNGNNNIFQLNGFNKNSHYIFKIFDAIFNDKIAIIQFHIILDTDDDIAHMNDFINNHKFKFEILKNNSIYIHNRWNITIKCDISKLNLKYKNVILNSNINCKTYYNKLSIDYSENPKL